MATITLSPQTFIGSEYTPSSEGYILGLDKTGGGSASSGNRVSLLSANASNPEYIYWDVNNENTTYVGSYRVDRGTYGSSSLEYNDKWLMTVNTQNGNMLMNGAITANTRDIGEFEIPTTLSTSNNVADLPIAANTQPFVDVFDQIPSRTVDSNEGSGVGIYGIYEHNDNILFNYQVYYDAALPFATQTLAVKGSSTLSTPASNTSGAYEWSPGVSRAGGWISPIPAEWQTDLGGDHITGFTSGTTIAILGRLSVGPSAFAFNIADIINTPPASGSSISTTELMNFPYPDVLGLGSTSNVDDWLLEPGRIWNNGTDSTYGFIIPGTSTYMCVGHQAGFTSGLGYKLRDGTSQTDFGDYDAVDVNDYRNAYWLFDVNDFVAVRAGTIAPESIVPYEYGTLNVKFEGDPITGLNQISSATFDPATNRFYISVAEVDNLQSPFSVQPVINVYDLSGVTN